MNKTDYKDDEIDLKELFATIWQKRFFVVLITALISLMGGVMRTFTIQHLYITPRYIWK